MKARSKNSYFDRLSGPWRAAISRRGDGLKRMQRRILVAMNDLGLASNRGYRKCAKNLRRYIGNSSPSWRGRHLSDARAPGAIFNMRYPLIDGQGNYGSVDGDSAAAMRIYRGAPRENQRRDSRRSRKRQWISFELRSDA